MKNGISGDGPVESAGPSPAMELVVAREAILARNSGLGLPEIRAAIVDIYESFLRKQAPALGITAESGFALVAIGGLARRDLAPHSDLDLVLVHDHMPATKVAEVAEGLWYPLWDANIKLDHSVRTVDEAISVAASDLNAGLGLLDTRFIVGDEDLTKLLIGGVRQQWRNDIRLRFDELVTSAQTRWRRSGEIAHRAEPDIKNGRGGLRDVHLLHALAIAQLTDGMGNLGPNAPASELRRAYNRLLDVRTEMHRIARRNRDQLRAQDADDIAESLGMGDRFDLSRTLSDCGRTISYATDLGIRTAAGALPRRGMSVLRRPPTRRPLDEGVVEHNGEVTLARSVEIQRDVGLVIRVAAASARTGLPMSGATLTRLAEYAPELPEPWPGEVLADFLGLLGSGPNVVGVIEALDRTGLWGKILPEWAVVRDLPPRDPIHMWTVDRHLVETLVNASGIATRVSRPDLLVLSALLHDIGKGREGDHSIVGAQLAETICARMGLAPDDTEVIVAVVLHHLVLPTIATRRDVSATDTAQSLATTVNNHRTVLEILHALVECDSLATGPGVWNEWKDSLITGLVRRSLALIAGEKLVEPEALSVLAAELAAKQLDSQDVSLPLQVQVKLLAREAAGTYQLVMVAPDKLGVLTKMAAVIAMSGFRCIAANVYSIDGNAVNEFVVSPLFGTPTGEELLRQRLLQTLSGSLDPFIKIDKNASSLSEIEAAIANSAVAAPPVILWHPGKTSGTAVLEIRAIDSPVVLARVAALLERHGVNIVWAKVMTLGAAAVDSFSVTGIDGTAPASLALREKITSDLLEILPQPVVRRINPDTISPH